MNASDRRDEPLTDSSRAHSNSTRFRTFSLPQRFMAAVFIVLLALGGALTGLGLIDLIATEASAWRRTDDYLAIFAVLTVAIALVGLWRGPRTGILIVATLLILVLGAMVPVAVVLILALSIYALGCLLTRAPDMAPTDRLLLGIVAVGTVLSILVQLPVNNTGTWALLFALPLLLGWRHVGRIWPAALAGESQGAHLYLLHCAIGAAALLHLLVAFMPETGHDGLAMHLFVPAYVAHHQAWSFDAGNYVWAVMPMLVDWFFTAGYLFAGETAVRLVNVGSILLLATMVYRSALWAGANRLGAAWAVLLLLVTPLTFLESSSLFIEGLWSAMVLGGSLALLRLGTTTDNAPREILLASILLAGALAAKAVTFTLLPLLALVMLAGMRRWFARDLLPVIGLALLLFVIVGGVPYIRAYWLTGNPMFPFFNGYFESPLYPLVNFSPPARFELGFAWDTLYRITFDSARYLDATKGSAGFQWLLLVLPGLLVLALYRNLRGSLLGVIAIGWLWLTFGQTAYLRYVLPSFALACAMVAVTLTVAESTGRWTRRVSITAALVALGLNLFHLHAATWYGEIDLRVITNPDAREVYIERVAPVRNAVDLVNALNQDQTPVAFFTEPLTAGLKAEALYASWYNSRFQAAVIAAENAEDLGRVLAGEQVEYIVLDETWREIDRHAQLSEITTELARISTVSVRRLDQRYRSAEEPIETVNRIQEETGE